MKGATADGAVVRIAVRGKEPANVFELSQAPIYRVPV